MASKRLVSLLLFMLHLWSSVSLENVTNQTAFDSSLDKLSSDYAIVYVDLLIRGLEYNQGGFNCLDDLRRLAKNLEKNDPTAKKMVDYSGRVPAQSSKSFIDFGSYQQCMKLKSSGYCLITGTSNDNLIQSVDQLAWHEKNSTINYMLDLDHHLNVTRKASLLLGLCLPTNCAGDDVETLSSTLLSHTNLTIRLDRCEKPQPTPIKLSRHEVFALIYLGFLVVCHLMGPCSTSDKPLSAFNIAESWKSFIGKSTRNRDDQVNSIYGLKALCMGALVLGNLQYLTAIPSKFNPVDVKGNNYPLIGSPVNTYLHLMDTFFFISGFLSLRSAYSRLRSIKSRKVIFVRCFKYSSMITVTVALYFALFNGYVKSKVAGPLWESVFGARDIIPACKDHWWSEILLIDLWRFNYNHCTLSSWYLGIDLLSFSSSLYFVIPWLEMKLIMIILVILSFGSGLIAAGFSLYKINYPSTIVSNQLFTPGYFDFINIFLSKPWIHGVCYMMGVLTAFHMRKPRQNLSKLKQRVGTFLSIGSFVFVHWLESSWSSSSSSSQSSSSPSSLPNRFTLIAYGICIRLSWAASFGWIIYLIESENQFKWINRFLSQPFFRSLSKLNISLLLTNFLVIRLRNATHQFPVSTMMIIDWLIYHLAPNLILIYGLALLLTLTVEIPATRAAIKSTGIPEKGGTGRILTRPQIYSDIKVINNTISQEVAKNGPYQVNFDRSAIHSVKF
ncbi:O-acyltransferase like protein-like [Panonychus citri]|uniref:O-acyltransferase like protein-like n=1 Tax=Panonychus citri TaxID=50023 RepID=UPI00230818BF|nr:O-acyltransferase like protein-like [Panonychus citri]